MDFGFKPEGALSRIHLSIGLPLIFPILLFFSTRQPAFAEVIVIDWDHTANCGANIFNPEPCDGFCECLANSIGSGNATLCDGSRRDINPDDWANLIAVCAEENEQIAANPPVVYPPGSAGCPNVRWPECWSPQCRIDATCELGDGSRVIDGDCPSSGTAQCSGGGTIDCGDPKNPGACGGD